MEERYRHLELDTEARIPVQNQEKNTDYSEYIGNDESSYTDLSEFIRRHNDDDDMDLVSPNQEIFRRVSGSSRREPEGNEIPNAVWVRGNDSGEFYNKKHNDLYANTAETEHNFMKTFGILDDSRKNVSAEENSAGSVEIETLQGDIHSDYYEYADRQQRKEIIGMYKYAKRTIKLKLIFASIFAFLLMLVENVGFFSKNLYVKMGIAEHPYIMFFINMGLLLACMACAYEQLLYGGKSILAKEHIPESVSVYACLVGIVYSLITLIFVPFGYAQHLCNFPVAFICVLSLLYSYINVIREKYGFSIVSSKESKFVLNKISGDDAETEYETFTTTGDNISGNINIVKVEKTDFVKNYFARTNESADVTSVMDTYSLIALIAPIVLFIIAIIRKSSFTDALYVWFLGFLAILPAGILFTYSIPFFMGNRKLFNDEVSLIGEDSVNEYSGIRLVSVNDTTAFPPYNVKLQNFKVYNNYSIEKTLYYAASAFGTVGGPLAEVFDITTREAMPKSKKTRFICSGRSYFCVKVDNDVLVFADRYGMASQGVNVPYEREEVNDDISVMYMSCNGQICAKMYITYMIDEEFANIVRTLNRHGTSVMLRTFDPNINNEIIKKQTVFRRSELSVVKLTAEDQISKTEEKMDSGAVSRGRSRALLKAIPISKNITKIRKANLVVKIIASLVGTLILGLSVFGVMSIKSTLLVGAFYIPWMLIMLAISKIYLSRVK